MTHTYTALKEIHEAILRIEEELKKLNAALMKLVS